MSVLGQGSGPRKIRPYEHLNDDDLWKLAGEAADLRIKLAEAEPGAVFQSLIEHGCPRKAALRQMQDPILRPMATRFYIDLQDARLGDPEAVRRRDHVVGGWERLKALGRQE